MGMIVIEAIKQAPFIKGAINFKGTDIDDSITGKEVTTPYEGKLLPGATRDICPQFSSSKNKFVWDEEYLPKPTMKEYIPLCGFYNDKGDLISDINVHNEADPFITKLVVRMEGDKVYLDDSIEKNKIIAAFFRADRRRFKIVDGNSVPAGQSREEYLIGFQEDIERHRVMASEAEMTTVMLLQEMSRKKMLKLCKIWDYKAPEAIDDFKLKAYIWEKMKGTKRYMGNQTRAQWFVGFAKLSENDLGFWDVFLDGRRARVITRNNEDVYVYNGIALGRHEQESVDFLMQPGNGKMVNDMREQIKKKKVGTESLPLLNLMGDGSESGNTSGA